MNKVVWVLLFLGISFAGVSQTRRIAHRAHNGTSSEHYDGHDGNYGEGPMFTTRIVAQQKMVRLDSGKDSVYWVLDTITESTRMMQSTGIRILPVQPVNTIANISEMGKVCKKISH